MGSTYIHGELVEFIHPLIHQVNLQRDEGAISVNFGGVVQLPPSWAAFDLLEHNAASGPCIADTHYDSERGQFAEEAHDGDSRASCGA